MKWPWQRDDATGTHGKDVDVLLAEGHAAAPAGPFRMTIEDVFSIRDRGTVATGKVETGTVTVGQQVSVLRAGAALTTTRVTGVEMYKKRLESASVGDYVGLLLDGVTDADVMRDDVLEG